MKPFITLILSVLYLSTSLGFSISLHYCGDEIEYFSINWEAKTCGCGEMMDDCCTDEVVYVQIDADQLATYYNFSSRPVIVVDSEMFITANPASLRHESEPLLELDLPPPKAKPVYILNCSLTFYG